MDDGLARDLAAIWQSELTAMAADRELREGWSALVALWARMAVAAASLAPQPHDGAAGSADAAEPARAAAAAAASQPGLAEIERLAGRIAELEQRLAGLERDRPPP